MKIGSKPEMIIICKKEGHEPFPQSPDVHINHRAGCPTCANELTGERCRLIYDEVFNRLNENSKENNTTVSFKEEEYKGVNAELIIKCSKHGDQKPRLVNTTFEGTHPCLECTVEVLGRSFKERTKKDVIQYLNEKFEGKYKIYDFKYEDKRTVIKFNCPIEGHGDFSFQVGNMYRSNGCPVCSYEDSIEKRTEGVRKHNESTRKSREKKWIEEWDKITSFITRAGLIALILNVVMMTVGFYVAKVFASGMDQRKCISLECGLQNGTLAVFVSTQIFDNIVYIVPTAAYALIMFFTSIIFVFLVRKVN